MTGNFDHPGRSIEPVREPMLVLDGQLWVRTANHSFYRTFRVLEGETSAKYTEPGGRIALTTELRGGEAVVTVQDNGIGVPAESQPNLFEMFSPVDRSLERAQGGLGIGLALVKGLTEAHGGRVEVHSKGAGHGCTFIVRLPVTERKPPAGTPQVDTTQPASKGRILVVDDNRDGAASLTLLLTVMGNDTRTAHDGLERGRIGRGVPARPDRAGHRPAQAERVRRLPPHPGEGVGQTHAHCGGDRVGAGRRPPPLAGGRLRPPSGEAGGRRRTQPAAGREEAMTPGPAPFDYTPDFKNTDFRQHPELYRIGKGEQGVLLVEPYKSEILPHWRFKTVAEAKKSSAKIYKMFLAYLKAGDFVGADMSRMFLQMGWTRSRGYANHCSFRAILNVTPPG